MAVKPPLIVACQDYLQPPGFAMRQLFVLAVALLVGGGYAAFYADCAVGTHPKSQAAVVQSANEPREPTSSGVLESDRQGHFQVEARVEGRFVDFVVDTGASLVVLRETTAAQVGIRLQPRDYSATAVTVNGKIMAARATIERIEVGGIAVYDVPAMVLPDEALATNLLGVSFL